jgi:hypothetical protein
MEDGGATALGGFFYQLLGSAADLASATTDPLASLLLEPSHEDALLSLASGSILVQFKYSAGRREIAPAELAKILLKLEEHDGGSGCTWRLSTNRPFSPDARCLLAGTDTKGKPRTAAAAKNRSVIKKLRKKLVVDRLTFTDLDEQLSKRGQLFGLTADEIQQGAHRLVGTMMHLVQEHGPGAAIGHAFLDEHLVGFPDPGHLYGADRAADVAAELDVLASSHLNGPSLDEAVPRKALANVFRTPDEPVVVVTGPGGCGKSLSVLRAVRDHVLAQRALGGMLFSDRIESLEDLVAKWRNPKRHQQPDRLELTLERLRIANPRSDGWILVLGLDGLDEDGWRSPNRIAHLRELVRCVRESRLGTPLATAELKLIITCRDKREVDDILAGSGVGAGTRNEGQEVPLDMFDDRELREIWFKWFPHLPLPISAQTEGDRDLELISDTGRSATVIDQRVAHALRQPTMLGCFRELGEVQQRGVLNGDAHAWTELMQKYLVWFTRKVFRRRTLPSGEALGMLSACAKATSPDPEASHDRDTDWVRPAVEFSERTRADALRLFEDAVTSGLIETDAGNYRIPECRPVTWRWRYAFVEEYLRTLA